jgi:alkaline phosphatase
VADPYEVLSQLTAMEIDPGSQDLVDTLEVTARAKPAGTVYTVRLPIEQATPAAVDSLLAERAATLNAIHAL